MALIKAANVNAVVRDASVFDMGDLRAQARMLLEEAQQKARRILEGAQLDAETVREIAARSGRSDGYAEGRREGAEAGRVAALASGQDDIECLIERWSTALDEFQRRRDEILLEAEHGVIAFALEVAERVIHRMIATSPELVVDQVREALTRVRTQSRLLIRAHPDDQSLLTAAVPDLMSRLNSLADVEFITDQSLQRGDCMISTSGGGAVDASIHTQMERIAEALLDSGLGGIDQRDTDGRADE